MIFFSSASRAQLPLKDMGRTVEVNNEPYSKKRLVIIGVNLSYSLSQHEEAL